MKHLLFAYALGGVLVMALVSSPSAVAEPEDGLSHRVARLEAKEAIRSTILAFVNALNSAFIDDKTDPLGPIADALHPEILLTAFPPAPLPGPMVFEGLYGQNGNPGVINGYGQGVVVMTKPNIIASAIGVQLGTGGDTAEANLRFANSVFYQPAMSIVMLFADVHVTFELSVEDVWQVKTVDLVHYLAHGSPLPMMP